MSQLSYCGNIVRMYDPDRFLLSLFMGEAEREALWVLFAFNHEIAKTREIVSETQLGLIRLQWWREEIAKIYGGAEAPEHEILQPLARVIRQYGLPQEEFEALIYGREFDLEGVVPSHLEGTLKYVEATNFPLYRLIYFIVFYIIQNKRGGVSSHFSGGEEEGGLKQAAVNYGLMGVLRAVPFHARQGRCYLPEGVLKGHGVRLDHLYQGKDVEKLRPVTKDLLKRIVLDVKHKNKYLKLSDFLVGIYYNHLKNNDFDVFVAANVPPPKFKELRLFLRSLL